MLNPVGTRCLLATLGLLLALGGCASRGSPVVADHSPVFGQRPHSYQVRAGDTLYSIAWRYGLDVVALARANNIRQPFTIYPQQNILLRQTPKATKPRVATSANPKPSKPAQTAKVGRTPDRTASWGWPVKTAPLLSYGEKGSSGISQGIYYELPNRTSIQAAAAGKVVYAGPGLGGYERLLILEHGPTLLSAYGFHGKALVAEEQEIKVGSVLADTWRSGAELSRFHFEVRKHGRPVDPKDLIARRK